MTLLLNTIKKQLYLASTYETQNDTKPLQRQDDVCDSNMDGSILNTEFWNLFKRVAIGQSSISTKISYQCDDTTMSGNSIY